MESVRELFNTMSSFLIEAFEMLAQLPKTVQFLILLVIPFSLVLLWQNKGQVNRQAKALRVPKLPNLPDRFKRLIQAYLRAFSEDNTRIVRSVSSTAMQLSTEASLRQLDRFAIKKDMKFVEDKKQNYYSATYGLGETSTSIHSSQSMFFGALQVDYKAHNTGRLLKRVIWPETRLSLGFVSSIEPKRKGRKVNCQNCGAEMPLVRDEEECAYCKSRYRYGDFGLLLNAFSIEKYKYQNPLSWVVLLLPAVFLSLFVTFMTDDFLIGLMSFGLIFVVYLVLAIFVLERLQIWIKKRLESPDEGFNKMQMVAEGVHLYKACCFTAPKQMSEFLEHYVHPAGHVSFRKLNASEYEHLIDYLPRKVRVEKVSSSEEGQFLELILKGQELRRSCFGSLRFTSRTRRLRLWREKGVQTERFSGLKLSQCPNCGGQVSFFAHRHCPYCKSSLPLDPQVWRLYGIS